jgi:hypothetical protein
MCEPRHCACNCTANPKELAGAGYKKSDCVLEPGHLWVVRVLVSPSDIGVDRSPCFVVVGIVCRPTSSVCCICSSRPNYRRRYRPRTTCIASTPTIGRVLVGQFPEVDRCIAYTETTIARLDGSPCEWQPASPSAGGVAGPPPGWFQKWFVTTAAQQGTGSDTEQRVRSAPRSCGVFGKSSGSRRAPRRSPCPPEAARG